MAMKDRLHTGELYDPSDSSIMIKQGFALHRLKKFNKISPLNILRRTRLMKKMFAEVGKNCYIESPFYANWGGKHVHLGEGVYFNFGVTLVDDTHIYIGDHTMFGPNVTVATAGHPVEPSLRLRALQYNMPVTIGKNCWIGAGALIMPGVTIGDNTVIGAGSVVTKDIPSDVVAVGNPCKVLRPISERDKEYYYKDNKIDWDEWGQK